MPTDPDETGPSSEPTLIKPLQARVVEILEGISGGESSSDVELTRLLGEIQNADEKRIMAALRQLVHENHG